MGVHLRYHKQKEYQALNKEQRAELHKWRKSNPDAKTPGKNKGTNDTLTRKQVASLLSKQVKAALAKAEHATPPASDSNDKQSDESYILSLVTAAMAKAQPNPDPTPTTKKVSLKSILKQAWTGAVNRLQQCHSLTHSRGEELVTY